MPRDKKDEKENYFLITFFLQKKSHILNWEKENKIHRKTQDFITTTENQSQKEKGQELKGMKNGMKGCIEK